MKYLYKILLNNISKDYVYILFQYNNNKNITIKYSFKFLSHLKILLYLGNIFVCEKILHLCLNDFKIPCYLNNKLKKIKCVEGGEANF